MITAFRKRSNEISSHHLLLILVKMIGTRVLSEIIIMLRKQNTYIYETVEGTNIGVFFRIIK